MTPGVSAEWDAIWTPRGLLLRLATPLSPVPSSGSGNPQAVWAPYDRVVDGFTLEKNTRETRSYPGIASPSSRPGAA